jgi:nucleoside-diphosphate-sugar epimerase
MRLLVLGGTRFLGRAIVDDAISRGYDITTFTQGLSGQPPTTAPPARSAPPAHDCPASTIALSCSRCSPVGTTAPRATLPLPECLARIQLFRR